MSKVKSPPLMRTWGSAEIGIPGVQFFGFCRFSEAAGPLKKHQHENCFEFILLLKGKDEYCADGKRFPLCGGKAFVAFPRQVHYSANPHQGVGEFIWFQLNPDDIGFLGLTEKFSAPLRRKLKALNVQVIPVPSEAARHARNLAAALQAGKSRTCCAGEMISLLSLLLENPLESDSGISSDILHALNQIRFSASDRPTVSAMAQAAGLSESGFKHKFRKETGFTPNDYLCRLRIEKAAELLRSGSDITSAAMNCGFSTGSYFSVVFRKYMRMSPSEYRRQVPDADRKKI